MDIHKLRPIERLASFLARKFSEEKKVMRVGIDLFIGTLLVSALLVIGNSRWYANLLWLVVLVIAWWKCFFRFSHCVDPDAFECKLCRHKKVGTERSKLDFGNEKICVSCEQPHFMILTELREKARQLGQKVDSVHEIVKRNAWGFPEV